MTARAAGAAELFVWYRCTAADLPGVTTQGQHLLARIARDSGVQGRLLVRCDEPTVMEHFVVPAGQRSTFLACLATQQAALAADFPARHAEWFESAA